jgi:TolB-like protein/Tfp pilus assembly protein PilF
MKLGALFAELKRRNLYKVAIAYAVIGWLLVQIATQVFPFFAIPNSVVRMIVGLIIVGFPIAVVSAWAFELPREGIDRAARADRSSALTRRRGRKLTALIVVVATLAAAVTIFRFLPATKPAGQNSARWVAGVERKSIAVLPFENLSTGNSNAYFTDGVQDEILTHLSKIADLKVISRTSTQHYVSAPQNLAEISRQLGVAHFLEGTVQKSGDTVRLNVQLIAAADNTCLWAESFDRKLTDILSVESEVAKAIADQLQARLTGREEQVIAARPTENPEAYDVYLRGLACNLRTANSAENSRGAQTYLREAVRLDPKFALAWTLLSFVDARGYLTQTLQPTAALRDEAREAAAAALTLEPELGEALHAKGYYHYACLKDYGTAVAYFERARPLLPNSSRIPESLAYVTRRQGRWDTSDSYFKEAERLDPRNVYVLGQHGQSCIARRRFAEARSLFDRILQITPNDMDTLAVKAAIAQAEGDLPGAAVLLAPLHPPADDSNVFYTQVYQAILERRPASVVPRLKELLAKPDPAWGYFTGELRFWLGWAQDVGGDHAAAEESWRTGRGELKPSLREQAENYNLLYDLALTEMALGDKGAALAFTQRAMAAMPIERDAFDGPAPIEILARVAAQLGEPDRAIAALQKLLSVPYEGPLGGGQAPLTPALLRLDPMFDPLRNDPRFQTLVAGGITPSASAMMEN